MQEQLIDWMKLPALLFIPLSGATAAYLIKSEQIRMSPEVSKRLVSGL